MPPAHSGDIVMRVTLANVVAVLTALFFIAGGYTNLFPPEAVVQDYERWGYPGWFSRITGILELVTAVLLVPSRTRLAGVAFGGCVMLAAVATLLVNREWLHAAAPLTVLFALCVNYLLARRTLAARPKEYRA